MVAELGGLRRGNRRSTCHAQCSRRGPGHAAGGTGGASARCAYASFIFFTSPFFERETSGAATAPQRFSLTAVRLTSARQPGVIGGDCQIATERLVTRRLQSGGAQLSPTAMRYRSAVLAPAEPRRAAASRPCCLVASAATGSGQAGRKRVLEAPGSIPKCGKRWSCTMMHYARQTILRFP